IIKVGAFTCDSRDEEIYAAQQVRGRRARAAGKRAKLTTCAHNTLFVCNAVKKTQGEKKIYANNTCKISKK
ncbi:MAG: hypothetical protein J6X52_03970, partial [Clostridia bacterium]|nr:hypothetical protein [Clostridia bacterium]